MTDSVKTWNGIAVASVKTYDGIAKASVKSINGVSLTPVDPYWANVVLLAINDSAANNSTTFIDQSTAAHTLTAHGTAKYTTATAPSGLTSSAVFAGGGTDNVTTPDSADWDLGTGDFAIEGFSKINSVGGGTYTAITGTNINTGGSWGVYYRNSDKFLTFYDGTSVLVSTGALSTAGFLHWAISKTSGNMEMYVNGTRVYNAANSSSINDAGNQLVIGNDNSAGSNNPFNGWSASIRITEGSNRGYTGATISVPSLPMPT